MIIRFFTAFALTALLFITAVPIFAQDTPDDIVTPYDRMKGVHRVAPPTWETERTYWIKTYPTRPYYKKTIVYSEYDPAYKYGHDIYETYHGRDFSEIPETELEQGWIAVRGPSTITWDQAREAVRDSYTHTRTYRTRTVRTITHP